VTQLEADSADVASELVSLASSAGVRIGIGNWSIDERECPHLDSAACGALWLTGAVGQPAVIDFPLMARSRALCRAVDELSSGRGTPLALDERRVFFERAAQRGLHRQGAISANGSCQILQCAEGWIACNLPRPDDAVLLAAALGCEDPPADSWRTLADAARRSDVHTIAERLQLFGLAVSVLGESATDDPVRFVRMGATQTVQRRPKIVDFSAMWAGPLCAHLLGRCGAEVVTVEDPARPDATRLGDPAMYERLHRGHQLAPVSFSSTEGRRELHRLVELADVVIESSRPRALHSIGLSPEAFVGSRPGRCWISLTGYGRAAAHANRAAFGDDAAVAGGLVGWSGGRPVFVGDAIADPASGLFAAFGGLAALAAGGGFLVEVSMGAAAAFLGRGPRCPGTHGVRQRADGGWCATHDDACAPVRSPTEALLDDA
jgi:hypothetical protein